MASIKFEIGFNFGSVVVKYIMNDFDDILNKESLKVNNYD